MPPELDDKLEGLDPSAQADDVTEATEVAAQADDQDAGAAGSSPADDDQPKDMSSVVRDVVAKPDEAASSAAKAEDADDAGDTDDATADAKAADDPDYKDVPFHKHPRFQELLRKSRTYEADAGQYRKIQGFMRENHLEADEAADGLRIMALAKTNPAQALAEIKPFVQKLLLAAGEILPDDLKNRVQQGDLTAAAAQEISRSRATVAQQQEAQRLQDERRQQQEAVERSRALRDTADAWARDRDVKDPSFKAKYPLLEREVAFLQRKEGVPNTAEGVRDQLNRAYQEVNRQARVVAPAPAAKPQTRPIVGGAAPGTHSPQPQSMVEAVRAARAR